MACPRLVLVTLAVLSLPGCMMPLARVQADADLKAGRHAAALAGYDVALREEFRTGDPLRAEVEAQRLQAATGLVRQGLELAEQARNARLWDLALGRYDEVGARAASLGVSSLDDRIAEGRQTCRDVALRRELAAARQRLDQGEVDIALADLAHLSRLAQSWHLSALQAECGTSLRQAQAAFLRQQLAAVRTRSAPVDAAFTRLAGLRRLALQWNQPQMADEQDPPLLAAAETLWTRVQPQLAQPGHVRGLLAAEALATPFAAGHPFRSRVAPLRVRAWQEHLAQAEAARGHPLTRRLYLRLAQWLGAPVSAELPALDSHALKLGKSSLQFVMPRTGACQALAQRIAVSSSQGQGMPVRVDLDLTDCRADVKRWQTTEAYNETRTENYTQKVCTSHSRCTGYYNSGPRAGACMGYTSYDSCDSTPRSRTVSTRETRTIDHVSHSFGYTGNARLTWEDGALTVPLAWQKTEEAAGRATSGAEALLAEAANLARQQVAAGVAKIGALRAQAMHARAAKAQQAGDIAGATEAWLEAAASEGRVPTPLVAGPGERYGLTEKDLAALLEARVPTIHVEWVADAVAVPSTASAAVRGLDAQPTDAEIRAVLFAPAPDSGQNVRKELVLPLNRSTQADPEPALTLGMAFGNAPLGGGATTRAFDVSWRDDRRRVSLAADLPTWGGKSSGFALAWTWPLTDTRNKGLQPIVGMRWTSQDLTTGEAYSNVAVELGASLPLGQSWTVWTRLEPNLLRAMESRGILDKTKHFTPLSIGVGLHLGTRVLLQASVAYYFGADLQPLPSLGLGVRL